MRKLSAALIVVLSLGTSAPVPAQTGEDGRPGQEELDTAERTIRDAIAATLRALEQILDTIPRYEAPEILDNGDIIIRKIRPGNEIEDDPPEQIPASADAAFEARQISAGDGLTKT